jgi:pathogenesis-related protein 1
MDLVIKIIRKIAPFRRSVREKHSGLPVEICGAMLLTGFITVLSGSAGEPMNNFTRCSSTPVVNNTSWEFIGAHNTIRSEVKLPPLQWSSKLAAYSQKWADKLIQTNRTAHNANSPYGENILITGLGSTPSIVVKEWASEAQSFNYQTNSCTADCGHYTQIIWRDTAIVGCGVAHNAKLEVWVCSYDPPGNYNGEWPY